MGNCVKSAALAALVFAVSSVAAVAQTTSETYSCVSDRRAVTVYEIGPKGDEICFANIYRRGRHRVTVTASEAIRSFIIQGYEDHIVRGIRFENCTLAGKPLKSTQDADFHIGKAEDISFE